MLGFSDGSDSLFSQDMSVRHDLKLPQVLIRHLGVPEELGVHIQELHFLPGSGIEDIQLWTQDTTSHVGFGSFCTSLGKRVALRYDMSPSVVSKFGREKVGGDHGLHHPHFMIPYLDEMSRRGLEIEKPLGFLLLRAKNGGYNGYAIIAVEDGETLRQENHTEQTAFLQGTIMRRLGDLGILHRHPRIDNWLFLGHDQVRLVDGKGVVLQDDYPHRFVSGRIESFPEQHELEVDAVRSQHKGFPERIQAYTDGYQRG